MTYGEDKKYDAAYTYGLERIEVEDIDETRPESQDPLYYLYDGLGSTTFLIKPDGNIRDHYRYNEYGKPAPGNTKLSEDGRINLNNTFGYTGEMWDEETNLLYLRARYYEPEIGRFLSRDTYEGDIENPLSRNLYAYVQNNPVNFQDPSGNLPIVPILVYLGETALETLPDVMLDVMIDGKNFNLAKSAFSNYGFNLIPGLGEAKKVKKVAKVTKMFGQPVAEYLVKHGYDLIRNFDKIIVAAKKSGVGGLIDFVKKRAQLLVKGTSILHGHHTFLKSLGGHPKQKLTRIVDYLHRDLHADLYKFEGGWLAPKRGYSGTQIVEKFGEDKVIEGLRRFYSQDKYKSLLKDFEEAVEFTKKNK